MAFSLGATRAFEAGGLTGLQQYDTAQLPAAEIRDWVESSIDAYRPKFAKDLPPCKPATTAANRLGGFVRENQAWTIIAGFAIGAADAYEPRCRACYTDPDAPGAKLFRDGRT